jgi:hypothetical protein
VTKKEVKIKITRKLAGWHTPVLPALGRLREEDPRFQVSLDYRVKLCLKIKV